jgi:uncharacterized membrane protein YphA (DoxX/SURF4 family)
MGVLVLAVVLVVAGFVVITQIEGPPHFVGPLYWGIMLAGVSALAAGIAILIGDLLRRWHRRRTGAEG